MNKREFERLLDLQRNGETSPEEEESIRQAFKKIYFSQQPFDWNDALEDEIKGRIKKKIFANLSGGHKDVATRNWLPILKVAAILALVLLGGLLAEYYLPYPPNIELITKRTDQNQRATITLNDGTIVHLNVGSSITFPKQFKSGQRIVRLEGEAFFEVTRNEQKPFVVETTSLTTKVLGTSFNINAHDLNTETVTVISGKVQVSQTQNPDKQTILLAEEAAVFQRSSGSLEKQAADAEIVLNWTNDYIKFDMVSFDEAVRIISESYHIKINLENYISDSCKIRAICKSNGVENLLSQLQLLVDFDFQTSNEGNITINYRGCKN